MKLKLEIVVHYNANGVSRDELVDVLKRAAEQLSEDGLLSGETKADVDDWSYKVT